MGIVGGRRMEVVVHAKAGRGGGALFDVVKQGGGDELHVGHRTRVPTAEPVENVIV
jgi:hypothetical protein